VSAPDERDELRDQLTPAVVLAEPEALELLTRGELTVEGRLVDASNATLYCAASLNGVTGACVYKPESGERPLWDFPDGTLACRETAAYVVSRSCGWGIVPPTVRRETGPFGPGMVQLWIDVPDETDLRAVLRGWRTQLQQLVVFDAVINNADRKGGHLLPTADGHLYAVDHGVCFHIEEKLRTILWNWAGEKLPDNCADALLRLRAEMDGTLSAELAALLTSGEVRATRRRLDRLIATDRFPEPSGEWPATPWPPW
jgi:Phosphatidylinositol 3- and 4-kinase